MTTPLIAGFAQAEITPPVGAWLLGCEGPSNGLHDPLFATALVLQQGEQRHVLISLDLIGFAHEEGNQIREQAAQAIGLTSANVTLMCSHTHSAPFTIPWSVTGWNNYKNNEQAWSQWMHGRIAQAVDAASRDMRETQLGYARAPIQIGQNRRTDVNGSAQMIANPDGSIVPWSDVITLSDAHGALRGVLYSQAAHPVMIHKASRLIGADYPGVAARRIRQRLGAHVMPMFAQSCGADNNAPWATGYDVCELQGNLLGDAIADASARATPVATLRAFYAETVAMGLPLKQPPHEAALLQMVQQAQALPAQEGVPLSRDVYLVAREQLRMLRDGRAARSMPYEMQVLAFGGELAIVALSNEVFSAYQLAIDARSPFQHTAIWAYCNTVENYIPADAEHSRGGYELTDGPRFYRFRSGPAEGTETLIIDAALAMLERARKKIGN